jgi:hypothetical protein
LALTLAAAVRYRILVFYSIPLERSRTVTLR